MKKLIMALLIVALLGCRSQEKEPEGIKSEEKREIAIKPTGEWEVQKKYDEFGNLVEYDSIYRYFYSNKKGDSIWVNLDSIMDLFKVFIEAKPPFKWNDGFSYFPKSDSLLTKDFFNDDYFMGRWEHRPFEIEETLRKMDSIRNAFLRKHHPGLLDSKEGH